MHHRSYTMALLAFMGMSTKSFQLPHGAATTTCHLELSGVSYLQVVKLFDILLDILVFMVQHILSACCQVLMRLICVKRKWLSKSSTHVRNGFACTVIHVIHDWQIGSIAGSDCKACMTGLIKTLNCPSKICAKITCDFESIYGKVGVKSYTEIRISHGNVIVLLSPYKEVFL